MGPFLAFYSLRTNHSHHSSNLSFLFLESSGTSFLHPVSPFLAISDLPFDMAGGARNQNRRVAIREGAGDGIPAAAAGRASEDDGPIPGILLDPTDDEIETELKSHLVLDVSAKVAVVETILRGANAIAAKLSNANASAFFAALPKDVKGERKKNQFLCPLFLKLSRLLSCILSIQTASPRWEPRLPVRSD